MRFFDAPCARFARKFLSFHPGDRITLSCNKKASLPLAIGFRFRYE
jgi:hypothetical protein